MSETSDARNAVADAENAAIFTYGVISAYVSAARRSTIADQLAAHRARRDEINAAIVAAGDTPPPAAAGYTLPVNVTDPVSSARAALAAETDCAVAYRSLIERGDSAALRGTGVDGLTESTGRIAYWRAALNLSPVTLAFPGSRTR